MAEPRSSLSVTPGVAAVLFDAGQRVLLHRRRVGQGWAPPSGHLEPGESIEAALHRELWEETGLDELADVELVGVYSDPAFQIVEFGSGRRVQFVTTLFTATVPAPETVIGNDEATRWEWFSSELLPEDLLPYAQRWLADALGPPSGTIVS